MCFAAWCCKWYGSCVQRRPGQLTSVALQYPPAVPVIQQGLPGDRLYGDYRCGVVQLTNQPFFWAVLLSGKAALYTAVDDHTEIHTCTLHPGQWAFPSVCPAPWSARAPGAYFGELAMANGTWTPATLVAQTACEFATFDRRFRPPSCSRQLAYLQCCREFERLRTRGWVVPSLATYNFLRDQMIFDGTRRYSSRLAFGKQAVLIS